MAFVKGFANLHFASNKILRISPKINLQKKKKEREEKLVNIKIMSFSRAIEIR